MKHKRATINDHLRPTVLTAKPFFPGKYNAFTYPCILKTSDFFTREKKEATKTGLGKISGIIIVTPSTFDSFKNFKRGKMRLKRGGGHIGIPFKGQIL